MSYFDDLNSEIKKYFNILCPSGIPDFILPYLETNSLKRLAGIDLFCGMYYTNVPNLRIKHWYSRLDHSVACALMAWELTQDKEMTIAALIHDIGTPIFSHAVDFKLGDSMTQSSSEVKEMGFIKRDPVLLKLLGEDNIDIEKVSNPKNYPSLDKDNPALCIDRLDGIFTTNWLWRQNITLRGIEKFYLLINSSLEEKGRWTMPASEDRAIGYGEELVVDESEAESFLGLCISFAQILQCPEDKFMMSLLGDILRVLELEGIISAEDFYKISEAEAIERIVNSDYAYLWYDFINIKRITKSNSKSEYKVEAKAKVRYCEPLIYTPYGTDELGCITDLAWDKRARFGDYFTKNHAINVTTELSPATVRVLTK